jgi:ABC-type Mn2+/Zn2+ transport system permease subunit
VSLARTSFWVIYMLDLLAPFLVRAYVAIVLSAAAAAAGAVAVLRGVSYLPAEASHAALGGVSIAVFLGFILSVDLDPFYFAILFSACSAVLVAYAGGRLDRDAINSALGGVMAVSLAVYALLRALVPANMKTVIDGYLIGDILILTTKDLIQLGVTVLVAVFFEVLFYHEIMYICFDAEGAEAMGIRVKFYDYLMFFLMGLSGGLMAKVFGSLLVFALVMAPAAAARMFSSNVKNYLINTTLLTVSLGFLGLFVSIVLNLPSSGVIAGFTSAAYILSLAYSKAVRQK